MTPPGLTKLALNNILTLRMMMIYMLDIILRMIYWSRVYRPHCNSELVKWKKTGQYFSHEWK